MNAPGTSCFDTASAGSVSVPALPAAPARQSEPRYTVHPAWGQRSFESADTHRMNQAHWQNVADESVNVYLAEKLPVIRARAAYESRQNGTILGVMNTFADDVAGPSGPTLQVISDDNGYNDALELEWREWFKAPTIRKNVSGAAWLKLDIKTLFKAGEYLAQLITDPDAEGPVKLRLRPTHPRRLLTPPSMAANPNIFMGIEFDGLGRPSHYYVHNPKGGPGVTRFSGLNANEYSRLSPDDVIHEFLIEEEDQARGVPWLNTALAPAGDLRDYDVSVQDAARSSADNASILCATGADVTTYDIPEQTTIERGTLKMAPLGWELKSAPAVQPPAQYPDYRAEKQRDIGRPVGMPLMMIRLDSSEHSYAGARLDSQGYDRSIASIQQWISGDEQNRGTLNRLVDEVAKEARFSNPALRRRPKNVRYVWTWAKRGHVDPLKESMAELKALKESGTITLTDALAARGETLDTHIAKLQRELKAYKAAKLPVPEWLCEASNDANNANGAPKPAAGFAPKPKQQPVGAGK